MAYAVSPTLEACRTALQRLKQSVEFHRQQLGDLVDRRHAASFGGAGSGAASGEAFARQVRDAVRTLDVELRDAQGLLDAGPGSRSSSATFGAGSAGFASQSMTYGVLRQSLQETQRRCDDLNEDMARQTEASEELVQSLGAVKDTNKRLIEQIQVQTDEIGRLTQQRIADEERSASLMRKHRTDKEAFEAEAKRRLQIVQDGVDRRYEEMQRHMLDKLRHVRARMLCVKENIDQLKRHHAADAGQMLRAVRDQLRAAEGDVMRQVVAYVNQHCTKKASVESCVQSLKTQLEEERQARHQEIAASSRQQAILSAHRDDIQAQSSRAVAHLTSQMQSLEQLLNSDKAANSEQLSKYEKQHDALLGERDQYKRELETLNQEISRFTSLHASILTDIRAKDDSVVEFSRQHRESDGALAAAFDVGEHLRAQITEHSRRFQAMTDDTLSICQDEHARKLEREKALNEDALAALNKQVRAVEDEYRSNSGELARLRSDAENAEVEATALRQDLAQWKSRCDVADSARQQLEDEFAEERRDFSRERLGLLAAVDKLAPQIAASEAELKSLSEQFTEQKRVTLSHDTEMSSKATAMEELLKDTQSRYADAKSRLVEATETLDRTLADCTLNQQRMGAAQETLRTELEQRRREVGEELRQSEEQLAAERHEAAASAELSEQAREAHGVFVRHTQGEYEGRLAILERERVAAEERYHAESGGTQNELALLQERSGALERELERLRRLLSESEGNLHWVRQEKDREERESAFVREQLQDELHHVSSGLEAAISGEASVKAQIESAAAQQTRDSGRLTQEITDMRSKCATQQAEADVRQKTVQCEHDTQLQVAQAKHQELISGCRGRQEALTRENEQLRLLVGEKFRSPTSAQSQLESNIQRLQRHTEALRSEVRRPPMEVALGTALPALTSS